MTNARPWHLWVLGFWLLPAYVTKARGRSMTRPNRMWRWLPVIAALAFGLFSSAETRAETERSVAASISNGAVVYSYDAPREWDHARIYGYDHHANPAGGSSASISSIPAARGGAGPVRAGQAGEALAGATKNTTHIPSLSGTAKYRVPDVLDETGGLIGEVKNVGSLSYTRQLRDYTSYAQQQGFRFELYVRPSTQLSGPLQTAAGPGGPINLRYLQP